jgi:hypothetical protein
MTLLQHLHEVDGVLGEPKNRVKAFSAGRPALYRSTWSCGCAIDYIESDRDDPASFMWNRCGVHRAKQMHGSIC